ncbi:uncharacterized protein LOC114528242 isoform X2 [Dendronephthya gigantea]|uniref:uncharacterized protein LOC114528242 isoform X2 n=1 Tax=Dendronephthya gigantea TaxID=151771 RepID=UPI001069933F|nr:uncharacterized protein LOC114528242 isoform X2 [Dendronephthya gigantea]
MATILVVTTLFLCLLMSATSEANIRQNIERIEGWAEQLSIKLETILEKNFGLRKFHKLIDEALFKTTSLQATELLDNISIAVDGKLQEVLKTLISNKMFLESELHQKHRSYTSAQPCCGSRSNLRYDARFRSSVDRNSSCVITNGANSYFTSSLEKNYKTNILSSKTIKWQYFGSSNGSYHQYPSSQQHCLENEIFDPQLSSWYVNAAMSARKKLVIIIDRSGSMGREQRMSLAKDAALTVLDTLTPDDYVTTIAFSNSVQFPPGCFGRSFAKATASNLQVLKDWIRSLNPGGGTMYSLAFQASFGCFINSSSATMDKGKNIILFLTDGVPSDDPNKQIYPSISQGQQQMNNSVSILAYGLGAGISGNEKAKTVLTNIATQNRGQFSIINDGSKEKLNSAFGRYYQFFTAASGNIALGKQTKQSSVKFKQNPNVGVNGLVDGKCSRTNYEENPWWSVDLQNHYDIMAVGISNCCKNVMKNVEIRVGDNENREFNKICGWMDFLKDNEDHIMFCESGTTGRYVHMSIPGRNETLSICEIRVYQVLVPSLTLSMPCTDENGTIFGVTAVDMSLNYVFSQILLFSYGKYSYAMVIDVKGRVWIHPRAPNPEESSLGPSLLPLQIYESWANKDIIKRILNEPNGQITLNKVLLQFPQGYASTDSMKTKAVNGTLNWKRLRNMFILIILVVEDDFNVWLTTKQVKKKNSTKENNKVDDRYFNICQFNGTPFFNELSTVKLSFDKNRIESDVYIGAKPVIDIHEEIEASHPGVVSDVVLTGYLENNWRDSDKKDDESVMWRYVGTDSGVYRRYPGSTLSENLNYKTRPWYRQAVMNSGKAFLSHPFKDPYGRGQVISISKAVQKSRGQDRQDNTKSWTTWIMGVSGIDMTLSSFRRLAMNAMPGCSNEYDCFLMDQSGYLYVNLNEPEPQVHVTEKFYWIGKELFETRQIFKTKWCNDFVNFRIVFSYEAIVTDTVVSQSPLVCRQYILVPLPNVSSSLLVIPSRKINLNCQDRLQSNYSETCKTCSQDVIECQTPCSCPMSFDRCSNSLMNTFTEITCPAPSPSINLVNAAVRMPDQIVRNSTTIPECDKVCNTALNNEHCSEMSHCVWCENFIESCESFCPFNYSQRIGLMFTSDLTTLIPEITNQTVKGIVKKNLQQTIYKTLGENLENHVQEISFEENSMKLSVRGSSTAEIFQKLKKMNDAIVAREFPIDISRNGGGKTIFPEQLFVLDFNECLANVHDCHVGATCIDTEEFYNCSCKSGFFGDGKDCTDLNECDQFPCDVNAKCINNIGSFKCSCSQGFAGNGFQCLDENECNQLPCHSNAICVNFQGSYNCSCKNGFSGNGTFCADVNECDHFPCDVNAKCINQIASFKCSCLEGFDGDGLNCLDSNECDSIPCHLNASCINIPGSFKCSCLNGFSGDGFICQDLNECDNSPCHDNATCVNHIGSFVCSCLQGFHGNGFECQDSNECDSIPCHLHASCINIPGSFKCSCSNGFSGDGFICKDLNECDKSPCHDNATCVNHIGSFGCSCLQGFHGNGFECQEEKAVTTTTTTMAKIITAQTKTTAKQKSTATKAGNNATKTNITTTANITKRPKTTEYGKTTPTKRFGLEKSSHFPTITVIAIAITTFIIGISLGLCFIWFVFLRRSSEKKNKVRPSQCVVEDLCLEENGIVTEDDNDEEKLFCKRERMSTALLISMKHFQPVSNVRCEMQSEVEI